MVALMMLEHQVGMRIASTPWPDARFKRDGLSDADWTQLDAHIDDIVGSISSWTRRGSPSL
jgi:hypothetical protein